MAEEPESEVESIEINAKEILDKIIAGKDVVLNDAVITGGLDLTNLALQRDESNRKIVNSKIEIVNCDIKEKLDFSVSSFRKPIYFNGSEFKEAAKFNKSQFEGDANFRGSQFKGNADFFESQFEGDTYFIGSQFKVSADFMGSHFKGNAYFDRSQLGYAIFEDSQFEGWASFAKSQFEGFAFFFGSQFKKYADFTESQFKEVNFSGSQFKGFANFTESQFEEDADFIGSQFEGDANFSGSKFEGDANFTESQFDRKISFDKRINKETRFNGSINLDHCKIYSIYINAEFRGRQISLKYPDLNHLFARWDSIKDHVKYDGSTYLALVKNYNTLEWFEDADQCYYEYRKLSQKNKNWYDKGKGFNWSKFIDCIALVSCGYGVRLRFVLGWMVGLIILFTLINNLAGNSGIESAFLSTMAFTTSIPNNTSTMIDLRYAFVVERLIGTIFIALFVVVLTKKLIR